MSDCSRTEVFLAEWERMCDSGDVLPLRGMDMKSVIQYVQAWSYEHPAPKPKTYADMFREKFPKNTIQDWALWQHEICRKQLFEGADTERCEGDCVKCWNEPYKEEK